MKALFREEKPFISCPNVIIVCIIHIFTYVFIFKGFHFVFMFAMSCTIKLAKYEISLI